MAQQNVERVLVDARTNTIAVHNPQDGQTRDACLLTVVVREGGGPPSELAYVVPLPVLSGLCGLLQRTLVAAGVPVPTVDKASPPLP
jgi:hypothetical protein